LSYFLKNGVVETEVVVAVGAGEVTTGLENMLGVATEVGATELVVIEVGATELDVTGVDATELGATELVLTEVDATEVDATEVDATELGATELVVTGRTGLGAT